MMKVLELTSEGRFVLCMHKTREGSDTRRRPVEEYVILDVSLLYRSLHLTTRDQHVPTQSPRRVTLITVNRAIPLDAQAERAKAILIMREGCCPYRLIRSRIYDTRSWGRLNNPTRIRSSSSVIPTGRTWGRVQLL